MNKNIKVILTNKKDLIFTSKDYTLELGICDNQRHFDHHREFSEYPAPCNNDRIPVIQDDCTIYVNHVDADGFTGIRRMMGTDLPPVDFEQMEKVDLNGSFILSPEEKLNDTNLYQVGINQLAKNLKIPFVSTELVDITEIILQMVNTPFAEVCKIGKEAIKDAEKEFDKCFVKRSGSTVLLDGRKGNLNPSSAYEKGFTKVTVLNRFETISLYARPDTEYSFSCKTFAGVEFAGHPKACGSNPRDIKRTLDEATRVFEEISLL